MEYSENRRIGGQFEGVYTDSLSYFIKNFIFRYRSHFFDQEISLLKNALSLGNEEFYVLCRFLNRKKKWNRIESIKKYLEEFTMLEALFQNLFKSGLIRIFTKDSTFRDSLNVLNDIFSLENLNSLCALMSVKTKILTKEIAIRQIKNFCLGQKSFDGKLMKYTLPSMILKVIKQTYGQRELIFIIQDNFFNLIKRIIRLEKVSFLDLINIFYI